MGNRVEIVGKRVEIVMKRVEIVRMHGSSQAGWEDLCYMRQFD